MANPILATLSLTYYPDGSDQGHHLVRYGTDVLTSAPRWPVSPSKQEDAIIGAPWISQIIRDNNRQALSFEVARPCDSLGLADTEGMAARDWWRRHPQGRLVHHYAYEAGQYTREEEWIACLDKFEALPLTSATWYGMVRDDVIRSLMPSVDWAAPQLAAWRGYNYTFTLTQ